MALPSSFDRMNDFLNTRHIRPVTDHVYPFEHGRHLLRRVLNAIDQMS